MESRHTPIWLHCCDKDGMRDPHSMNSDTHNYGATFTSTAMLEHVKHSIAVRGSLSLALDGTYRLFWNGYTLLVLGTLVTKMIRGHYSSTCLPLIMMIAESESNITYSALVQSLCFASFQFLKVCHMNHRRIQTNMG